MSAARIELSLTRMNCSESSDRPSNCRGTYVTERIELSLTRSEPSICLSLFICASRQFWAIYGESLSGDIEDFLEGVFVSSSPFRNARA